jgi:predicted phage baseplate assembly protein
MNKNSCGCSTLPCGCCEGTEKLTPAEVSNRPGLDALRYRVGTHARFFETMKARLSTLEVDGLGKDGQTPETFRPLAGLTTRQSNDPAIALLDSWATVADVLTFYQERIANEGYLRTATERRSVLELARLVGYELRPGVAATVFLAYTLEDKQLDPVEIPAGARSQSIPAPGETPQAFETSDKLLARVEWNNLEARRTRPQKVALDNVLSLAQLYVSGTSTNLNKGDQLLFVFGQAADKRALRLVDSVEADFAAGRSIVQFQAPLAGVAETISLLRKVEQDLAPFAATHGGTQRARERAQELIVSNMLGVHQSPATWRQSMESAADVLLPPEVNAILDKFQADVQQALDSLGDGTPPVTDPATFVSDLLKPVKLQPASSLRLNRNLAQTFKKGADVIPQLLVNFETRLKDTYYAAWRNARVNDALPALEGVFALRLTAPLFGATVSKIPAFDTNNRLETPDKWTDWPSTASDEQNDRLFLDQAREEVAPSGYAVIQKQDFNGPVRLVRKVVAAQTLQRTAYGISGTTTQLTLDEDWWNGAQDSMSTVRSTLVFAQSEPLILVEEPITAPVEGQEIELGALYDELTSGRWVIVSGERTDIPGVTGVLASELHMISGLRHGYDATLPGDKTHTTLILATSTAHQYKRESLVINGNVVKATHGETRNEVLGSGDGAQSLQSFTLKQPPLTYVAAPIAAGAKSTLEVFVNELQWHEVDTLAGLGPKDRAFVSRADDASATTITFGNGAQGARLPTGVENLRAVYRSGIGQGGNVKAAQISLLQTRPLGVKAVINPLRASGGADKESRDLARENAPLSVMALDRLVGVQDYGDFTRTFAGIGKALAARLSDGHREVAHITIAGADDIPIDTASDLYANLLSALRQLGDPGLPVRVASRELVALAMSAKIKLRPDYQWDPVAEEIRRRVLEEFAFQKRALGQPALLCEAIAVIQNTPGVAYVDVDVFGGIPEKKTGADGTRRLLTQEEIADAVAEILGNSNNLGAELPLQRVLAATAGLENGSLRPAQLVIFTPAVPDTLILNQIV